MGEKLCILITVAATVCLTSVSGYKDGKVTKSCGSMLPNHGHQPNTTASPYSMTVDVNTFKPGDHIKVILSGTKYFEGFLLQARDAAHSDGPAVGSFALVNPQVSQLLKCNNIQGSAASHTSDARNTEVQVIWTAPPNAPPTVQFLATVVAHYNIYWVKISGPVVHHSGLTPPPTPPTTSTTTQTTTTPAVLPHAFSSGGCGSRKSCLQDPVGCDPASDTPCFFLSFATEGQSVRFELSGPAEGYVAFALSWDKWMGNDDVYLCVRDEGLVAVDAAYATGRTHPELASQSVLSEVAWRLSDGVIQCRFSRAIHTPQDPSRFSLDHSYYLFLAHGRAEYGEIHRHDRQPLTSTHQSFISGPPEVLAGSRSPVLMKCHGVLMLIAWMLAGSIGTLIASYFKPEWPEKTLFGQKIWFQVHRGLMFLTVMLTCVGFTLPFFYRGKWSQGAGAHPYLGCTVLALALLQPIMAAFRPPPDSSRRWMFSWLHWGAGNMAEIIAVAAMFVGVRQQSLLLPSPWATGVLGGFLGWVLLLKTLLWLHKKGFLQSGSSEDAEAILSDAAKSNKRGTQFKMAVLLAFVVGNVGFLIALISSISGL